MADSNDIKRWHQNLQAERDAIILYERLAEAEANPDLAAIYQKLADTERRHAGSWEEKLRDAGQTLPAHRSAWRTRVFGWLAKRFGTGFVLQSLAQVEREASRGYDGQPDAHALGMPEEERSHARVFGYLAKTTGGLEGSAVARFEGRHRAGGGNALRAGVLGANDGLVSDFSLVMGVAGAGVSGRVILLTGLAGLLAGALSMALGEWLSVQSSRELYQHQIGIERHELRDHPGRGDGGAGADLPGEGDPGGSGRARWPSRLLSDESTALDTLAREELGIDPKELGGSAWEAALTSFVLFALGAIVPVLPYFFFTGTTGIIVSAIASGLGLFGIGAAITLMTGRNALYSGLRQVLFGLAAAAITFGVGRLIGVNLS